MVYRRREATTQRTSHIAEQDDSILVGFVHRLVNIGLVEHDGLAVAPTIGMAINVDSAFVVVRRNETEMAAQRSRVGISVGHQLRPRWQQGEHGAIDRGYTVRQGNRMRAKRSRGGQRFVVPLQIESLPAGAEEGIESQVVILVRGLHL